MMSTDEVTGALLLGLLRRTHLSAPDELAAAVAEEAVEAGARHVRVHLVDYEQQMLVPLAIRGGGVEPALSVAGSVAGRAFTSSTILRSQGDEGPEHRLWLPLLDGTDRVGVLGLTFDHEIERPELAIWERFAHLVALLVITKGAYTDLFERVRRRRHMTIASELANAIAPPAVFATDGLTVSGMLEPAYDNGGDGFDYAINDGRLDLAVFDAMGHGLAAAGVAAFAVAAYRHGRRAGNDLVETHETMDDAVGRQFPDSRFVTAVIAQLELETGTFHWISAGHPPPLRIRAGHAQELELVPTMPLGVELGRKDAAVGEEALEPGDQVLLYTDGLTEARGPEGKVFAVDGLREFVEHAAAAGQPAPETLRRLRETLRESGQAQLRDDATALLVEWRGGSERELVPQTVF